MNTETLELKNSHYKLDARIDKVEIKVDAVIQRSDERFNMLLIQSNERWDRTQRELDQSRADLKQTLNNHKFYITALLSLFTVAIGLIKYFPIAPQ